MNNLNHNLNPNQSPEESLNGYDHNETPPDHLSNISNPKEKAVKKEHVIHSFSKSDLSYQILEYEDGDMQCACPDHFYRNRECKHIRMIKYPPLRKYITELLELRQMDQEITIFVDGQKFLQCTYLLIVNPQNKRKQHNINSIDEAKAYLSSDLETQLTPKDLGITIHDEFWAHYSNLQAWVEHDYDTRLLHSNLSFPLLKRLAEAGEGKARKVFKDEIAYRIECGYRPVIIYLYNEGYLEFLTNEELDYLMKGSAGAILKELFAGRARENS